MKALPCKFPDSWLSGCSEVAFCASLSGKLLVMQKFCGAFLASKCRWYLDVVAGGSVWRDAELSKHGQTL